MSADGQNTTSHTADPTAVRLVEDPVEGAADYVRRVYASTREWYAVAETKAQLLLTINGVFVTILFGALFGRAAGLRLQSGYTGPETWAFLTVSVTALACALVCAAGCLWSLHGNAGKEFARLGVDRNDPASYGPEVLWYFGHIALLQPQGVAERLSQADRKFEGEALRHNLFDLSVKVLRKHRWVNAGWAFTALALVALIAAGTSLFIRAQL